jgi:hypothetical protein
MKPCKKTFCKNNYAHYPKLKRYGEKCMHNGDCSQLSIASGANVINILDRPIKEGYQFVQKLTDCELEYCIHTENRAGGISRLQAEKRRRQ